MPCNQNPIKSLFQLSPLESNDYVEHPYLLYSCLLSRPPLFRLQFFDQSVDCCSRFI